MDIDKIIEYLLKDINPSLVDKNLLIEGMPNKLIEDILPYKFNNVTEMLTSKHLYSSMQGGDINEIVQEAIDSSDKAKLILDNEKLVMLKSYVDYNGNRIWFSDCCHISYLMERIRYKITLTMMDSLKTFQEYVLTHDCTCKEDKNRYFHSYCRDFGDFGDLPLEICFTTAIITSRMTGKKRAVYALTVTETNSKNNFYMSGMLNSIYQLANL